MSKKTDCKCLRMPNVEQKLEEAREEGRREGKAAAAKYRLKFLLFKHLIWFAFGCFIGGGAALENGQPLDVVVLCAVITGFVFSFIKWILFGVVLTILGC